jgi:opacity protein-like surface antigen
MLKKTLIAAGLIAASSLSFAAAAPVMHATATPWYVGVGLNYSAAWTNKLDVSSSANEEFKLNNRGLGGNIFVGYHVNKYFGTEFGFDYVGTDKYKSSADATTAKLKNQWNLHFVGNAYLPVNEWFSPFAFAGVGYMNGKFDNGVSGVGSENSTFSGFGWMYGAGLQFNIQEFGVRVKYTHVDPSSSMQDTGTTGYNTEVLHDYVSLDVLYRFGM